MQKKNNSEERKKYLRKNTITKVSIIVTQITLVILFKFILYTNLDIEAVNR